MKRLIALLVAGLACSLAAPTAPASAVPDWRTTGTSWTNPQAKMPQITDLRYARHGNFDRVVVDVTGKIPGGRTGYHRRFYYDGSGERVPIRGGLQLTLLPAYTYDADGNNVYDGPSLVRPGFPALKAIALTGSFEGQVSFAFGLSPMRAPYRVFLLHSPQRVVIDFKHPAP